MSFPQIPDNFKIEWPSAVFPTSGTLSHPEMHSYLLLASFITVATSIKKENFIRNLNALQLA